jgi:hypothetical protein
MVVAMRVRKSVRGVFPMASKALGAGPNSPSPPKGYIGAASAGEPELQGWDKWRAPEPSPALPPQSVESVPAKKNRLTVVDVEGLRENGAELPLVRRGLPKAIKEFIVENLACFQTHHAVRQECLKRFGLDIDGRTIAGLDPNSRHCRLGPKLRALYDDTRKRYIGDVGQIAISHQAQRLRLVAKVVEKATTSKDYAAALKGLELAAKEMGGVLEGKSIVEHRGGMVHVHTNVEDARREVAMRLAQIVDGGLLLPAPAGADNPEISADPDGHTGGTA